MESAVTAAINHDLRFCEGLHKQVGYPEEAQLFGRAADEIGILVAYIDVLKTGTKKQIRVFEKEFFAREPD